EAGQAGAVGAQHAQGAGGLGLDDVELVVAVDVPQALARLAAAGEAARPAGREARVAVGEQDLAVLPARAGGVGGADADGERGLVRIPVALALLRGRRVVRGTAARAGVER